MKRSKEIIGVPVISISAGIQVGAVKGLVINSQQKTVEFLLLKEQESDAGIKGIPFRYAEGVGEYAVTVENESVMMEISRIGTLQDLLEKNINIIGTKVITRKGKYLGDACEFSIDTETGHLKEIYYQVDNDNEHSVPIQRVITLGKEVLVVEELAAGEATEENKVNFKGGDERSSGSQSVKHPTFEQPVVAQPIIEQPAVEQPTTHMAAQPAVEQPEKATPIPEAGLTEREMLDFRTSDDLDPADAFIQRQRQFLIGKTLLKDLQSKEGEVIAWENEMVTEQLFDKAYKLGVQKVMELAMSVRE